MLKDHHITDHVFMMQSFMLPQELGKKLTTQNSPTREMDTTIEDLDKCECVSSVIKIAPLLGIEREKMGPLGILLRINDGVYVCICSVYPKILK